MLDVLFSIQNTVHATLSANLSAFAAHRDWMVLLTVLPLGVLFGAVHALTPGHGKSILASFLLGSGLASARAMLMALLLALTHVGSAVVLALIAVPLVTQTLAGVGRAPSLEMISRSLLIAIGLWLVLRAIWRRPHTHGEGIVVSVVAGLVPCPLTLFVMFFALTRGIPEAGLAFAVAMLLGVGFTLALVALLAILARNWLSDNLAHHGASMHRASRVLDVLSGGALMLIAAHELLR